MNFAYSLWTGGRALVSAASVLVVMPVVTFYIICDWHGMIEVVDGWVPVRQREIVRTIAREIDAAISGFMRGQLGVCPPGKNHQFLASDDRHTSRRRPRPTRAHAGILHVEGVQR